MKNKTLFKKVLCVLLAMTITGTSFAIAFGQKEDKESNQNNSVEVTETSTNDNDVSEDGKEKSGIKKEETVYVNLDPNGNTYSQIVSSRLHSEDPNVVVKDKSDLDNIIPIKGGSLKKNQNGELEWSIDQNDIYYRGTTERKMPMSVDIRYFLDGKEYKPEKLAGKSGKLRIEISVKNNQTHMVNICGKQTKIYSPLVVMVGAVFKDDVFSNVDVDEGNVSVDGSNFVVSMTAMPGLNETLNMKNMSIEELKDIEFHDNFVITADVKDFEMGPIAVVASTEFPDVDTDGTTLDDMKVDLVDLQNMQNDLENMDGDHEIRSLFTDTKKSDAARLLVDDIFELYDLNRTILDVLPKYVTHDNVKNLENFIDDIELVDLDELEDSEVLDYLEELLVKNDNPINFDELKTVVNTSVELTKKIEPLIKDEKGNVKALVNSVAKLQKTVKSCPPEVQYYLMQILGDKDMRNVFIKSGVDGVYKVIEMKTKTLLEEAALPAEDAVTGGTTSEEDKKADSETDSSTKTETTTDTDEKPSTDTDTSVTPPVDSKEESKTDAKSDSTEKPAEESTDTKADSTSTTEEKTVTEDKTSTTTTDKSSESTSTSTTESASASSETKEKDVLSAATLDEDKDSDVKDSALLKSGAPDLPSEETMIGALQTLFSGVGEVMTNMNNLTTEEKEAVEFITSETTKKQLEGMAQYFAKNEKNIELTIKMLNATDSRQAKRIARTASHLRDTIHDFKPQLFNLQRDIKKPGMRESLRESPEMIRTLVKMNGDLNDNRNISDILKRAVSEENSETFKSMIETLDRLIEEDAIGRYLENVDDIKELLERKDALVELSDNQPSYSGATDDAETSVRFIMKTDEIKKPEVKKEVEPVKEEPKGKIRSFFEKIFD